jgi:uridylate kinase
MKYSFSKRIVIALGGSIMYPEDIDSKFIGNFRKFIEEFARKGYKFVIVVGGGRVARLYQEAAGRVASLADEDKDWLGIHATRMNAHLIRTVFRKIANPVIIDTRGKIKELRYAVTVASGWQPGWSTDYVAMALAEDFKASEVVIMGKPDHVYDKDPGAFRNAKPLPEISWEKYRKLIPKKWTPGFHSPVDPVAAKLGEEKKIKALVVSGDLKNLKRLISGADFKGTLVS